MTQGPRKTGTETGGEPYAARVHWKAGDRCRTVRLGEWKNGTVVAIAYAGEVAMVQRDGDSSERAFPTRNLREPVDE